MRDRRLREREALDDLPAGELAGCRDFLNDAKAVGIGQSLESADELCIVQRFWGATIHRRISMYPARPRQGLTAARLTPAWGLRRGGAYGCARRPRSPGSGRGPPA